MELITSFMDWWDTAQFIVSPILIVIFLLGLSLGIAQLIEDKGIKIVLIVIVAGIFFAISTFADFAGDLVGGYGSEFGGELYLNVSAALLSALFALVIILMVASFESWVQPLLFAMAVALILLIFVPLDNATSNMQTNLATGLVGAWLTAYLIRKEWAWDPKKHGERLSSEMRQAVKEQSEKQEQFGDYFMLISGIDEEAIQQRIDFLGEHDMVVIKDNPAEFDAETETYYRLINVKIETVVKDREIVYLQNKEARIRVIGYPDTTKRVYKQLQEVLLANEQKRIDSPTAGLLHLEFKTEVPQKLFSTHIEEEIFQLARDWRHGDDEHLQHATDALIEWGKKMQFIKE